LPTQDEDILRITDLPTPSFAAGTAGDVEVRASRLRVRDEGLIRSSGQGTGPAGDGRVAAGTLTVDGAIAALPGETMTVLTGVPHAERRPPTIWEMATDGRWLLAEQDSAA
jgi:hypothetical protein